MNNQKNKKLDKWLNQNNKEDNLIKEPLIMAESIAKTTKQIDYDALLKNKEKATIEINESKQNNQKAIPLNKINEQINLMKIEDETERSEHNKYEKQKRNTQSIYNKMTRKK